MLHSDKASLRQWARRTRRTLAIDTISHAVCGQIENWGVYQTAQTVLGFWALPDEIDIARLMTTAPNKAWYLPRTVAKGEMQFYRHTQADTLVKGRLNIWEPDGTTAVWDGSNASASLILIPGLMLDKRGYRLGYGGGYYDRFLNGISMPRACLVAQDLWRETLPVDPWDRPVDYGISEAGITAFI